MREETVTAIELLLLSRPVDKGQNGTYRLKSCWSGTGDVPSLATAWILNSSAEHACGFLRFRWFDSWFFNTGNAACPSGESLLCPRTYQK